MFVDLDSTVSMRLTGPEREVMTLEGQYRTSSGVLDHNSVAGQGSAMEPGMSYGMDESQMTPGDMPQGALPHGESDPAAAEFSFRQSGVSISDAPEASMGKGIMKDMSQMYEQSEMREPAAQKGVLQPFKSPMSPEAKPAIPRPGKESHINQEQMTEIEKAMSWEKTHPTWGEANEAAAVPRVQFAETRVETGNAEGVEQMEAQLNMEAQPLEAEGAAMPQFLRGSSSARIGDGAQQGQEQGQHNQAQATATSFGYAHADGGQKETNSDGGGEVPAYDNTHPAAPEQMQGY